MVAIDGKQPKHAGGHNVVTAITTSSQHYLGCELVEDKSNEIPAARKLIARLDLDGKLVSLDGQQPLLRMAVTASQTPTLHHHRLPRRHGRRS